jgi:hypothetical protein
LADLLSSVAPGDLVVVCDGAEKSYGYFHPAEGGFTLAPTPHNAKGTFYPAERDEVRVAKVIGFVRQRSRKILPLAPL